MAWNQNPASIGQAAIDAESKALANVTPTFGDGTNGFTISAGSWVLNQVHDMVVGECNILWTSKGSASGDIELSMPSGLIAAKPQTVSIQAVVGAQLPAGFVDGLFVAYKDQSAVQFSGYNDAGTFQVLTDADYATSGTVRINATWFV